MMKGESGEELRSRKVIAFELRFNRNRIGSTKKELSVLIGERNGASAKRSD